MRRYNGRDLISPEASRLLDRDLRGDIWGVFITLTYRLNRDRPSRSDGHDLIETVHDRTVTKIRPIKRPVLHDCKQSSWISIKLACLDTDQLVSLDSVLFLFQFLIHGVVEIKIWWRIEGEIAAWSPSWRSWRFRWLIGLITSFWSLNRFSGSGFS